jgi:predicted TIM-barrel fold metal-dependent hydrolase
MKVIDPHIHLWDTEKVAYPWLTEPTVGFSGDNRRLPKRYDVAAFLRDTAGVEVWRSVHVEANPADPLAEARWLQALCDDTTNGGHPHGIVGYADLSQPNAPQLLEHLATCRNVRGIRQIVNVHPDARYNYVDRQYLREPHWRANLRRLADYSWSFDLQLYPAQVPDALEVIDASTDVVFIVNHAGMFVDRNTVQGWREWRDGLRGLAARANTALKLSGFAMFDHHWSIESLRPYVLEGIAAFGAERCMFASNFPIDGLHASYAAQWSAYTQIVSGASVSERDNLFSGNAARYYRLQDP